MFKFFGLHGVQAWQQYSNNTASQWWRDPGLRKNVFVIMTAFMISISGGYDKSLISSLQSLPTWKAAMGHPTSTDIGLITACLNMGQVVSGLPASYVIDRYGRRPGLLFGLVFMVIGTAIQCGANGRGMFIAGRVLLGFGFSFAVTMSPIMVQELAHPRMRGSLATLYNTTFYVGAIMVTWISFGMTHMTPSQWVWRIPVICQFGPIAYVIATLPFLPESPRYLVSVGREEEALAILAKYHSNGDLGDELVIFELTEIKNVIALDAETRGTWKQALSVPGNRKRFLLIAAVSVFGNFSGQAVVSYYLSSVLNLIGITSATQQTGLNGGLQIFNWFTTIFGSSIAESIGRRKHFLTAWSIMICANIIQTSLTATYSKKPSKALGGAVIFGIFLYDFGYNIAPLTYAYEVEIMPFHLRAKGMAFSVTFGGIQGVILQYCNPIGLAHLKWKFYLIYLAFLCIAIINIYLFFPETRGRTLEEVAAIFDGADVAKDIETSAAADLAAKHNAGSPDDSEDKVNDEKIHVVSVPVHQH